MKWARNSTELLKFIFPYGFRFLHFRVIRGCNLMCLFMHVGVVCCVYTVLICLLGEFYCFVAAK